ncbi:MAG: (Fe-S)-binding protein [Promethearchaeia archaeon]
MSEQEKRTPAFEEDQCTLCGLCLHECPVLNLPIEVAKEEIKHLMEGKESQYVLSKCNTCLSCNIYCPEDCNPYQLILERWNSKYKKRGAPPLYKFVCPTNEPNIWQLLNHFLSNEEKKWITRWVTYTPKPEDKILLIGNYTHLFPFIIGGSKLLSDFKAISRVDQWEGGAYLYQGGYLDVVQRIAARCKSDFDRWGVKNVAHTLDAVQYIFSEVHPKEMGVHYTQDFINFNEWMLDGIKSGKIKMNKNLNLTVTLHDNCFSKALDGAYWETPREILKECGCQLVEMDHIKKDSLCCGFGAGASWVRNISMPFDIIFEGIKRFEEAKATGADTLVSYCGGCLYLLWVTRELIESKIDIMHIIEIVRLASGEIINYPDDHVNRSWDIIAIITYQLLLSVFQRRFYIDEITYDKHMSTFLPKNRPLLKFIRFLFDFKVLRKFYSILFRLMMPILTTRERLNPKNI